eukprot:CAMPEP_0178390682 /NCGR_PEP_ID=MMETSP0689_2-20121128/10771_1 /TAXON_ID=160604 /ORGANISM="Amphidinium massartii, Strain CS-259" /LENGTH=713 /DNA_ID=CAMNT_0020011197 /DNA_START=231 /DNA_END=2368 /DNA_ORIENTATION=+
MGTCESSQCCSSNSNALPPAGIEKVTSASLAPSETVTLRILHFNDVYKLDHFPTLKAHVDGLGAGMGFQHVITTLAGDFVAPSLLSAMDYGAGMIDCMNAIPVDYVCFGNHESDIPPEALQQRIREFKGVWLNSNMPDWQLDSGSSFGTASSVAQKLRSPSPRSSPNYGAGGGLVATRLPSTSGAYQSKQPMLTSSLVKGLEASGRKVALLGLLSARKTLYRMGAFGGATESLQPVLPRAAELMEELKAAHPDLDCVIPLTHQDLPEDEELALTERFPVILGGHDHEPSISSFGGTTIVKAGQDAENLIVVDLTWEKRAPRGSRPKVETQLIRLAPPEKPKDSRADDDYKAPVLVEDKAMLERVQLRMQPVAELQASTLARFEPVDPPLSSLNPRKGPCSMASLIAAALRDANSAEGGLINAGSIRGNTVYHDGVVTFAHLTAEVPFPSANITIKVPGQVLSDAVRHSRLPWTEQGIEAASALHTDPDMHVDVDTGEVFRVANEDLDPQRMYSITVDAYVVRKNPYFKDYAKKFPENIPPDDAGQPALPCLVAFFCKQAWLKLAAADDHGKVTKEKFDGFFQIADSNGDEFIDFEELLTVIESKLGKDMATRVLARQMMNVVQKDQDGRCTYSELAACMSANIVEAAITRKDSMSSASDAGGGEGLMHKLSTLHTIRKGSERSAGGAPSVKGAKAERLRALLEEETERDAPEA